MKNKTVGEAMRDRKPTGKSQPANNDFISAYRISLVQDRRVKFDCSPASNSTDACQAVRKLITNYAQPDREQFYLILMTTKNIIIGINIVSVGDLNSTLVNPREVLKPAILANAAGIILCHNHPSGDTEPSQEDIIITRKIIAAAMVMGITVHDHLILSVISEAYYSMADNGLIREGYDAVAIL